MVAESLVLLADHPLNSQIEKIESKLLPYPQVDMPLTHRFDDRGIYLREIFMPAGTLVIGHEHKTRHFNIVLKGRALVMIDGRIEEIIAPCTFISEPGVRKVLLIKEDMSWQTVHPTLETDIDKLEHELIIKSDSFTSFKESTRLGLEMDKCDYFQAIYEMGFTHEQVRSITENESDQIPMPDGFQGRVELRASPIDGLGIFASRDFLKSAFIVPAGLLGKRTPVGRYTNHSVSPNSHMVPTLDGSLGLIASRLIICGEEITVDYRQARNAANQAECNIRRTEVVS